MGPSRGKETDPHAPGFQVASRALKGPRRGCEAVHKSQGLQELQQAERAGLAGAGPLNGSHLPPAGCWDPATQKDMASRALGP